MTPKTAQNIVNKLVCGGYSISLRKSKYNTISRKTWDAICSMLFAYYDCQRVDVSYVSNQSAHITAYTKNDSKLINCYVRLF